MLNLDYEVDAKKIRYANSIDTYMAKTTIRYLAKRMYI